MGAAVIRSPESEEEDQELDERGFMVVMIITSKNQPLIGSLETGFWKRKSFVTARKNWVMKGG